MRKRFQKLPKCLRVLLWVLGILLGLVLITMIVLKIWVSTWNTYKNDDFGFSFSYPSSWYINPNIISKDVFEKGDFTQGDFSGFIFYIDSKQGLPYINGVYTPPPGTVEVSFYKTESLAIQKNNRPIDCSMVTRTGTRFACINRSAMYKSLYLENDNYVYQISTAAKFSNAGIRSRANTIIFHWIGSMVLDSFEITK